jgi:hypothetical protein
MVTVGAKTQIFLIITLALSLTYGAAKLMWPKATPPIICADDTDCITSKDKANTDFDPHAGEGFSPPPD